MPLNKILELFDKQVDRRIEEVIKVDQTDVQVVREEMEEYVVTDDIRESFTEILERYQETPNKPHEGIGIWISGFFGAGKSSFAKILGYILENRDLEGTNATELFSRQVADDKVRALLTTINERIPTKAVIFDVSTDQSVVDSSEKITHILYRVLLRELGYSQNRQLAELEIELEANGTLEEFEEIHRQLYDGKEWSETKHLAVTARNIASRIRHELEPEDFPQPDTWAKTPNVVDITPNMVAERAFELIERRGDSRALVFVIDEVGQYVARSTEKMLDLQGLAQALGRVGRNKAKEWTGQVWLVVTSQERLSEVVDNLEGKQVEFAKVRDRFPIEVDLQPSDIREVTAKRILKKKPEAEKQLRDLFDSHSGKLQEAVRVKGALGGEVKASGFVELYPFLPYHIDLIINIVSGLRTQGGASQQVGGAARTIIKLAQQVLINKATRLGDQPVGRLVTMDMIYDLLEGLVNSERQQDINEIEESFGRDNPCARVAKALALLQFVRQFPRDHNNLAAVLHPSIDELPQNDIIAEALKELSKAQRVRKTAEGWELLSKAGKEWEDEKRGFDGSPSRRMEILEGLVGQVLEDVGGYRHKGLRTFSVRPTINGRPTRRSGDVDLLMTIISPEQDFAAVLNRSRQESNTESGMNSIHWVIQFAGIVGEELRELERTEEMIRRYQTEALTPDQSRLVSDEKATAQRLRNSLASRVKTMFTEGVSFFRGVEQHIGGLGDDVAEQVRAVLAEIIPKLFKNFDLIGVQIQAADTKTIIAADTLRALTDVYYEGKKGLGLVRQEGGEPRINIDHPALTELKGFIEEKVRCDREVQGKALEIQFTGYGYGWDLEVVKLLTATLFRAAEIEVYKGKRFTSHADTGVRDVFSATQSFRSASFKLRGEALTIQELTACAKSFEKLFGKALSVEEGAIANSLRAQLEIEVARGNRVRSQLEANDLTGVEELSQLLEELVGIRQGSTEDTVRAFHSQRESMEIGLEWLRKLEPAVAGLNLETLKDAKLSLNRQLPELVATDNGESFTETAAALKSQLEDLEFFKHLPDIAQRTAEITNAYQEVHDQLLEVIQSAINSELDDLRNRSEWEVLDDTHHEEIERPYQRLLARAQSRDTSLTELASLKGGLHPLHRDAVANLLKLSQPLGEVEQLHRIEVGRLARSAITTEEEMDKFLEVLRRACLDALSRGEQVILE
ncbi:BREX system P-loop protein BrxC [Gemmatimonadota bacterium]